MMMDILIQGLLNKQEIIAHFDSILTWFSKNHGISQFREVSLKVTLVNDAKEDVELVDNKNGQIYRVLEVNTANFSLEKIRTNKQNKPQLVVDNTKASKSLK